MPRLMQVSVSRGSSVRKEYRPIVHYVVERYVSADASGEKSDRVFGRRVPLLMQGEVEFISVTGQSVIIQSGQ